MFAVSFHGRFLSNQPVHAIDISFWLTNGKIVSFHTKERMARSYHNVVFLSNPASRRWLSDRTRFSAASMSNIICLVQGGKRNWGEKGSARKLQLFHLQQLSFPTPSLRLICKEDHLLAKDIVDCIGSDICRPEAGWSHIYPSLMRENRGTSLLTVNALNLAKGARLTWQMCRLNFTVNSRPKCWAARYIDLVGINAS